MEQASLVLFWFAFALYIGATVLYAYQFLLKRQRIGWWARFLTGAGFICQTLSIGANSIANGSTPFTGQNQLILASWALMLLYFVMEHVIRLKVYGAFLVPVTVVFMAVAMLIEPSAGMELSAAQQAQVTGWRVAFHVALIVFANAGFAVGAVSSILYLIQGSQLKRHKTSVFTRRMPSLTTLQMIARRAIALAYPVYTAGLFLGIVRALEVDVSGWWQDPRIMVAGIVWLVFGLYLFLVYRHEVSTRAASWIAVVGFVLVITLAVLARTLPVGFHVFGLS